MSSHETLWTPWRSRWVAEIGQPDGACPFCVPDSESPSEANLIVHRGRSCLAMMNLYPYNGGHLLVVPKRHVPRLRDLEQTERAELQELLVRCQDVLETTHRPHGFNIGLNEGRIAGAGIADHLHWHIVPRWNGDASFMTTIAGTRIVPDDMSTCWSRIHQAFQQA